MTEARRDVRVPFLGLLVSSVGLVWGLFIPNPFGVVIGAVGVAFSVAALVRSRRPAPSPERSAGASPGNSAGPPAGLRVLAKVRVPRRAVAFGGWKGLLEIDGEVLRVVGIGGSPRLDIDCRQVKRYSFNANNGMWLFRLADGSRVCLQMSGAMLSADRSAAGRDATQQVARLVAAHGRRSVRV